ncbi:MAG: cell division protein ZipA C-terminal FtsZ-binding domain-containing protein [Gammaproteobacteria bacterium]|nr:cell division protein ZipA C-terminal FtsZ-binding domain-containing protein [Gammaproteobacteria bacterium]
MEPLSWILLAVGLSALVAVLLWRKRDNDVGHSLDDAPAAHGADYDANGELLSEVRVITPRDLMSDKKAAELESNGETPPAVQGDKVDLTPAAAEPVAAEAVEEEEPVEVDKVIVLHVLAPHGATFDGLDLRAALIAEGLVLGKDGFFGRRDERNSCIKWRVANMLKPGTFDVASFESMQTPGLTLFMAMPGPFSFLDAYDDLVATGQRLTERLGGTLADERRHRLNDQTIAHEREAVIEYATHQKREQTELAL